MMVVIICFFVVLFFFFFFSSRRRHTRYIGDWSSDVCSSDLCVGGFIREATHCCQPLVNRRWSQVKLRSEERRVGKSVDLGGRRMIKKKKKREEIRGGQREYNRAI